MNRKAVTLSLVVLLLALAPLAVAAPKSQGGINVPVSGSFAPDTATPGPLSTLGSGTMTGTFNVQRFAVQDNKIVAVGLLTATLRDSGGGVLRTIVTNATVPVATPGTAGVTQAAGSVGIMQAACEILHLELGPIDLNLLGLVVHLDQVVLDISAQPGAGNLLGNLLCAIAGLLDPPGPLDQIVALLNQILSILQNL